MLTSAVVQVSRWASMTSKPFDQWHDRDLPVLRAVVHAIDGSFEGPEPDELVESSGLSPKDVNAALLALHRGEYLEVAISTTFGGSEILGVNTISEKAYRAAGAWPSREGMADELLAALRDLAEYSDDPVEKSRAKKALEALGGFSRDTLIAVIGASTGVALQ